MNIVFARPPNYDEILAVFPFAARRGTIFTYGQTVYNPSGVEISPSLRAHEAVHGQRQGADDEEIRAWWSRYLVDPAFRLEEELLAHRAEYRAVKGSSRDRNAVSKSLHEIANRLASPLYGVGITPARARHFIVADVDPLRVAKIRREERAKEIAA